MLVDIHQEELMLAWPRAYGATPVTGLLRQCPEYFFVEEQLGFEPDGFGEHVFLFIEKTQINTSYVAELLAQYAGVPKRNVSYSGMKDRNAVTRQWFSVHLPGNNTIDWSPLGSDTLTVLKISRHRKKLRRGVHKGNIFRLKLTELSGDLAALESRLHTIAKCGVPNYFGEQRFGYKGANVHKAQQWFAGVLMPKRHQRSIYLSAARSFIFNTVLAKRVNGQSWDKADVGQWVMLDGSRSVFVAEGDLSERLSSGDIHPTGPLYGHSHLENEHGEQMVFNDYPELTNGLKAAGMKQERRALRMIPEELSWVIKEGAVDLSFFLYRGCFATALVRELSTY